MSTIEAFLRLVRPVNLVIILLGVVVGAVLAYGSPILPPDLRTEVAWAAVSLMLVAAGGNVTNDLFDLEIDSINRSDRPLPSGRVTPGVARFLSGILFAGGLIVAGFVSTLHLGIALLEAGLLYVYSARLKRLPYVGNVAVAFMVSLALIYGGLIPERLGGAAVGAVFAFLTTTAREIVKDVQDVRGDSAVGLRTAPIAYGVPVARASASVVLILTIVLTPIPFLAMDFGPLFLLLVLVADVALLRCIWLAPTTPEEAAGASAWLKGAMLIGIASLFAA